ncbi:hypothetical protein [uncultured Vagococcus sp.]|uniref:hypothetical protein n=1 Tax=uncultured Vagococcus sp. TaxID=189676 RepID=UPI0028D3B1AA|nr:hypothetical protein [uncultured Vagococcus sp.]
MSIFVVFLEVLLWFALYPAIWWFVLNYVLEEYPGLNFLKLLSVPLLIALFILLFMILRDSTRFIIVFLIEGPNEAEWLAEQGPKIGQLLFWSWLLLPLTVRLISLTNSRDYKVLKRHVQKVSKKVSVKFQPEPSQSQSKKRKSKRSHRSSTSKKRD